MLLSRLVDLARRDSAGPRFHQPLRFDLELRLNGDGTLASTKLESLLQPDLRGKPRGVEHTVPAAVRTSGVVPNLAADDVQYVLGWADPTAKPHRVQQCHRAFIDLTRRWAESPQGAQDPLARAVAAFYASGEQAKLVHDPEVGSKQRVLITVDSTPAYRAPSVAPFWESEVLSRKSGGRTGVCLVCGTVAPLLNSLPTKVPGRLVPGADKEAGLVSVNAAVFGYGLTKQLAACPICVTCGEGVTAGLIRVLDSSDTLTFAGQDSRMGWWVTEPTEYNPMTLLVDADPELVGRVIGSIRSGRPFTVPDEDLLGDFSSLTVGGNVSRVVVREWLEMPLSKVLPNVGAWFIDTGTPTLHPDEPEHQPLAHLVRATGRWLHDKRYADLGAKNADRPDGVQRDLLRAALLGTPLPPALLNHLLHRIRTDRRVDTPRAALLTLALTRRGPRPWENHMPGLDETSTDPAYVAGRLLAAFDALQYDAFEGKINQTFAQRHFAGGMTNPHLALLAGGKLIQPWLRKFRGKRRGVGVNHSKRIDELFQLLGTEENVPSRANPTQQVHILLGFHHQRAHLFALRRKNTEQAGPDNNNPDE